MCGRGARPIEPQPMTRTRCAGVGMKTAGDYGLGDAFIRMPVASDRVLAAALALSGHVEEAREESRFFLIDNPDFQVAKCIRNQAFKDQKDAKFWTDAYLLAGLPE